MDQLFYFQLATWLIDSFTFIISVALVLSFLRLKRKAFGLYMILILNITALIFSLVSIMGMFLLENQITAEIFGSLEVGLYNFALFWSASIAVLVYTVVKYKKPLNSNRWLIYGLIFCGTFTLAILVATLLNLWGLELAFVYRGLFSFNQPQNNIFYQVMYLITYDIVGTILPIAITFYCYLYVFRQLRDTMSTCMKNPHADASRVLWYSGIQMVCFVPAVLLDIISMFVEIDSLAVALIVFILHRSWGFFNALAYWFLRTNTSDRQTSLVNSSMSGRDSLGSYIEI